MSVMVRECHRSARSMTAEGRDDERALLVFASDNLNHYDSLTITHSL